MNYFPQINQVTSSINVNFANIVWIVLAVALVIFGIISAILVYHWVRYSLAPHRLIFIMFIYFIVGGLLLAVALSAASYYQIIV